MALIAGAIVAAYSVLETNSPSDDPQTGWLATEIAPIISNYIPPDTLSVIDIPETGCSSSILAPERIGALLKELPSDQQKVMTQLLDTGSDIWEAQLYAGEHGVGICIPARNTLVLVAPGVFASIAGTN